VNPLQPWADYFVAQAGASAALAGLIFVVLSFNFDHIVSDRTWLGRAGTGLVLLVQPMLYGSDAEHPVPDLARRLGFVMAASVLQLGGALALVAGWSDGTYFLAVGSLLSLLIGLMIAWILLVEVRRLKGFGAEPPPPGS
jgi:hypothetical protein